MKLKKFVKSNPSTYLYALRHYHIEWLFVDEDSSNIEICYPNLSTLELMKRNEMRFVLKGFKSVIEYLRLDNLRYKYGYYSAMYATKFFRKGYLINAIINALNSGEIPSDSEIQEARRNNIRVIKNDFEMAEMLRFKNMYEKYSILAQKAIMRLIDKHRMVFLE